MLKNDELYDNGGNVKPEIMGYKKQEQSTQSASERSKLFFEVRTQLNSLSVHQYSISDQAGQSNCIHSLRACILPESLQTKPYLVQRLVGSCFTFDYFCSHCLPELLSPESKKFIETLCKPNALILSEPSLLEDRKHPLFLKQAAQVILQKSTQFNNLVLMTPEQWFLKVHKNLKTICKFIIEAVQDMPDVNIQFI